jgi:hypothetical protein
VDKQSKVFSITNKDFSTQKWPDLIARKSTEGPHQRTRVQTLDFTSALLRRLVLRLCGWPLEIK